MKKVKLIKGKEDFLYRKHPWIFSGAISNDTSEIEDGEVIEVTDQKENFCAIGMFHPGSIAVRVLSFENVQINQNFWNEKISNAVELRKQLGLLNETTNICRLVHGEGDNLSGLVIDHYNGVAIIQPHAVGMYLQKDAIKEALLFAIPNLKAIFIKGKETLPNRSDAVNEYLYGEVNTPHIAHEHGIPFSIDWITGQKTGFFIDQRENRKKLAQYAQGKKVLNTFCYSGGFSMYALKNGAALVHSLDSSKKAIDLVENNLKLIKIDDQNRHKSIVADAVKSIVNLENDYDIIILDPPAFAKHKNKRHQAIKAYTRLNFNAIKQIKKGGIIFTFSCSQVVDPFQFQKAVIAAAIQSQRNVRILEQLHQPSDHPVNAFHPEGSYLKGLILQID